MAMPSNYGAQLPMNGGLFFGAVGACLIVGAAVFLLIYAVSTDSYVLFLACASAAAGFALLVGVLLHPSITSIGVIIVLVIVLCACIYGASKSLRKMNVTEDTP